ncbi:MAG: energy-coupling factor transporter transmembrane component T [Eubacteriales bacterium]
MKEKEVSYRKIQGIEWIHFDPRSKLFALCILNFIIFSSVAGGNFSTSHLLIATFPFLALINGRKGKAALAYACIFLLFAQFDFLIYLCKGNPFFGVLVRLGNEMATRVFPCTFFAYAVLITTLPSEFLTTMSRLKIPVQITIPCAVMFRFVPTIVEEYQSIRSAMTLRGITFSKNPLAMIEYRFIPLMISILKISNELTAAALSRGLSVENNRSSFCEIKLKIQDYLLFAVILAILFCFIKEV